jgi:ethanolaminephosphotransferase
MRDFFFLSDDAAHALANYQYQGEDKSLLYNHVLSPLASFLVNRWTPHTIAPNTITLIGLVFMVSSFLLEWYYCPTLEQQPTPLSIPRFVFLYNCVAMLLYQTLDNMDGKQARRTGSSSPLGLLFDHGCDAANSMFGSANWIIAIGLSPTLNPTECWILLLGPMALFYIATWEEYYTGKLVLPIMNGPNEGLLLGALTSLTTFLYGVEYWHETTWYDSIISPMLVAFLPTTIQQHYIPKDFVLRNCHVQVLMATFGFVQETFVKITNVAFHYGLSSLLELLPFVTLCLCTFMIGLYLPVEEQQQPQQPRTWLFCISGLFVEMCAQLMLHHITCQTFPILRWVLLPLVIYTLLLVTQIVTTPQNDLILMYTSALWSFLLFQMTMTIHEICTVLNIWCFDIVTPRHARPLYYIEWKKS